MAYQVVIDAGHGGYDSGAIYNGRLEKDDTLALAMSVGDILSFNGIDVLFTRLDDSYISPIERANMANADEIDLFISLHRNQSPVPNTESGIKTLVFKNEGLQQEVAENINEELSELGFVNLGTEVRKDLAVLRKTNMPSVIVEVGYINSDLDNQLYDERFDDIAYGIAAGILDSLEIFSNDNEIDVVYRVQVGVFRVPGNAESLLQNLIMAGYDAVIVPQGDLYAVQVGNFTTLEEAKDLEDELRLEGYSTLIVSE